MDMATINAFAALKMEIINFAKSMKEINLDKHLSQT